MAYTEKIIDGITLKYLCQPCPECQGKLELFARYKKTLEDLTPGGSEYVNDPERCAVAIRDRFAGPITLLKRQKAKLQAAEEMAKAITAAESHYAMLCEVLCVNNPPPGGYPVLVQLRAALCAWGKAERGEQP